jgi:hypothetical protein
MISAPRWTEEELSAEAAKSRQIFVEERLKEPLARWVEVFADHEQQFQQLFEKYAIASPSSLTPSAVAGVFLDKLGDALRYLAGPPISADDLKVLADASLAPTVLAANPDQAQRILDVLLVALDPIRFPWVAEGRDPTDEEKAAAIAASAALITAQRVSTQRRNEGKEAQESAVKGFLTGMGFEEISPKTINTLDDAPAKGQFCCETLVGSRKADIPVRLFDGRLMPIECKVSNSSTNSVKRINNDAAVKAVTWRHEFGANQIVPVAMLSGVFKVHNLIQAQEGGLTLFWAHDLASMRAFIEKTATA